MVRKFLRLCRAKLYLAEPIGAKTAQKGHYLRKVETRQQWEDRSSHRNDAEATTYFENSWDSRKLHLKSANILSNLEADRIDLSRLVLEGRIARNNNFREFK